MAAYAPGNGEVVLEIDSVERGSGCFTAFASFAVSPLHPVLAVDAAALEVDPGIIVGERELYFAARAFDDAGFGNSGSHSPRRSDCGRLRDGACDSDRREQYIATSEPALSKGF